MEIKTFASTDDMLSVAVAKVDEKVNEFLSSSMIEVVSVTPQTVVGQHFESYFFVYTITVLYKSL